MKIYTINKDGEEVSKTADKGFYGEDVYNDRVWSKQKPPKQAGKIAVLEDKAWKLKDDVRGTYYRKEDGKPVEVRALTVEKAKAEHGIEIIELVKESPPAGMKFPKHDKGWKEDTDKVKAAEDAAKIAEDEAKIYAKMREQAIAALGNKLKVVKS